MEELSQAAITASDEHPVADGETEYEAKPPPRGIFDAVATNADELRAAVVQVPWRWRLDVVLAMEDLGDA
ncbi:MAG TPA: hypothetical protein VFH54_14910 [Mycobacteriales bacterium]|nr:hypothetical protein [Mycobacteriales bacterium]